MRAAANGGRAAVFPQKVAQPDQKPDHRADHLGFVAKCSARSSRPRGFGNFETADVEKAVARKSRSRPFPSGWCSAQDSNLRATPLELGMVGVATRGRVLTRLPAVARR